MIATDEIVGLAVGIIDSILLFCSYMHLMVKEDAATQQQNPY